MGLCAEQSYPALGPCAVSVSRPAIRSVVEGLAIFQLGDLHRANPRSVSVSSHL